MIRWLNKEALQVGQFEILGRLPGFVHGFSTRLGGVSSGDYGSLNIGPNTADSPEAIRENRRRFFDVFHAEEKRAAIPGQVHGDHIAIIEKPGFYPETDGLITATPGVLLTVQTADCVPVFIVDPVKNVAGLFHAGWRGTAANIVGQGVEIMTRKFGSAPANLTASIGPSIGPCCFEVGDEVLKHFPLNTVEGQHVDLWAANQQQLVASGLQDVYIKSASMCTFCQQHLFYSHRRDQGVTGRMMAVLGINFI